MRKATTFLTLFLGICLIFSFAVSQKEHQTLKDKPVFVPDEIVVIYDTTMENAEKITLKEKYGLEKKQTSKKAGKFDVYKHKSKDIEKALKQIRKEKGVVSAERNAYAYAFAVPNDPYLSPYQWHMTRIGMENAWDTATGNGVIVAIVDSGVRQTLEDFAGTSFMAGYDFINNDSNPTDDQGHGSHVAGTVAQTTNNALGCVGVAFDCTIMPVKVLNSSGSGSYTAITDGIYYAVDNGADIINLSLGGSSSLTVLENAINYAWNNGVVVICAAGNDNSSSPFYPAAYTNSISVSATSYDDDKSSFSNYGSTIDIAAPGGEYEDLNGDGYDDGILQNTFDGANEGYYFYYGTSMASPHVAGVAALVKSVNPGLTNAQIRNILETTAENIGSSTYFGNGLVDAYAAVQAASGGNQPPNAAFTYSDTLLAVNFTDQSTDSDGTIVGWAWTFGDGATSSLQNPSHTYAASGTYSVSLTVTDNDGATDTATQNITVSDGTTPEMYVQNIVVNVSNFFWFFYYADSTITIYDTNGAPVSNATVYVTWSGAASGSPSATTNASGQVSFSTGYGFSGGPFTITVTNVTHATITYNPALNNETSDSDTY